MFYTGVVENRNDPLKLGRCQVRVVGLHTENKIDLPTDDLPWAYPMGTINSASISGLGWSPTGVVQGTWVIVIFLDSDNQQPIMIGTIGGIPQTKTVAAMGDILDDVVTTDADGELVTSLGSTVTDLANSIADGEPKGVTQVTSQKYRINAVNVQLSTGTSTTYEVINNENDVVIATSLFDSIKNQYQVTLLSPESYEESQYTPFKGSYKTFTTNAEILAYFDKNF